MQDMSKITLLVPWIILFLIKTVTSQLKQYGSYSSGEDDGQGQGGGGEHKGTDWLKASVPGEPGVDYPIYTL